MPDNGDRRSAAGSGKVARTAKNINHTCRLSQDNASWSISIAFPSNTFFRYLVTKTRWTYILKTRRHPVRISLSFSIDQCIIHLMKTRKSYKQRLKVKQDQQQSFRQQTGCCRFVWNKALALQKECLNAGASTPFDTRKVSSWTGIGFSCPKEDGFGLSTAGRSRQHQEMSPCPGGGIIGRSRFRPSGKLSNQDIHPPLPSGSAWALPGSPPSVVCIKEHADLVGAIHGKRAGPVRFAGEVSGAVMPPAAGIHQGNCPEASAHA